MPEIVTHWTAVEVLDRCRQIIEEATTPLGVERLRNLLTSIVAQADVETMTALMNVLEGCVECADPMPGRRGRQSAHGAWATNQARNRLTVTNTKRR